jgi:Dynamin family
MECLIHNPKNESESATLDALAKTLNYAIRPLQASIGNDSSLVHRLTGLSEQIQDNRLQLAVLGQFKRGKSTFINALLGVPLLPVAVVPLTAVPVFIAWRQAPFVRVRFKNGRPPEELSADEPDAIRNFLFRFVAEEANPENRLAVSRVDLFYPTSLLAEGTVLIDTPGVGSTFRHNTRAALEVLPECDAALFVVSADPPITEAELDYLRHVKAKAARIFYILNKIDYLGAAERDSVVKFLREVLKQNDLWTPTSKIFSLSARDALETKWSDPKAFEASGMAAIEAHLIRQLATEKTHLLEAAMSGKVLDSLSQGVAEVSLRIQALKLPVDELMMKSKLFEVILRSIEERQRTTRDILAGEQRNLRKEIESSVASLRTEASSELSRVLDQTHAHAPHSVQDALSTATENIFDAARARLVEEFSGRTDAVIARYQKRIDADVDAVGQAAAEIFHTPLGESGELTVFALGHEPYWVTHETSASLIPDPGRLLERVLPKGLRANRIRARLLGQIEELVMRNAENLRWALIRGIDEAFREAVANLQARLDEAMRATRGVIEEALTRRRDATSAIEADLERLNRAGEVLAMLRQQISSRPARNRPAS